MNEASDNPTLTRIVALETAVATLCKEIDSLKRQEKASTEITGERLKLIDRTQETHHVAFRNVFERLRSLEATLFPNLAGDLAQVKSIIKKDDDKVRNPLDYRAPGTK